MLQQPNPYRSAIRGSHTENLVEDPQGSSLYLTSHDLKNTRELRTLLLEAAYQLQAQPTINHAYIQLINCTLTKRRLAMEVELFKSIATPQIASRILIVPVSITGQHQDGRLKPELPARETLPAKKPTAASQEAVLVYLLQRHLQSLPGVDIHTIAAQTKASMPTIYKVLLDYEHCIAKDREDKTLRLSNFTQQDWLRWIQRANKLSSVYFIDNSGSPRSATKLAKQLGRLQRDDLAIGGLMGALHHLPALDATSSPQLDILVHGTRRADLSFIHDIDPGLETFEGRPEMAHVVVHFIDRPAPLFVLEDGQNWGTLPDCIANMQKAGLTHQVNDALNLIKPGLLP